MFTGIMMHRCLLVANKPIRVDAVDPIFDAYHPHLFLILCNFANAFVYELNQCSVFNGFTVDIKTHPKVQAVDEPPVQLQPDEHAAICNHVSHLLASGHLSYSTSIWSANPFLVNNPAAGLQELGVNYCSLNHITLTDAYRLPTCEELLTSIPYSQCFSLIVLKDAFKQLALDEHSKAKTAFSIPGIKGKFEWNVLYGGLANSQTFLHRALHYCLNDLDPSLYKVYLGQILVCTVDVHQHLSVLQMILDRLVSANLRLDVGQCIFLCSSITFLGMGLSSAGVAIRPDKIERIACFPSPSTRYELQNFLVLIDQYRRYVPDYSQLVQPLIELVKRSEHYVEFDEKEHWTFEELKMGFLNADPIPLRPITTRPPSSIC